MVAVATRSFAHIGRFVASPRSSCYHRCYSSVLNCSHEQVKVPVGTNGFVTLDIHHPLTSSRNHQSPALLIHLPPGPSLRTSTADNADDPRSIPAALAASSSVPVISINYRLDRHHLFPTPIHDVLAAYDWAVRNILQSHANVDRKSPGTGRRSSFNEDQNESFGRVAVHGELVGGSLALMLALTECRVWDKARVVGASVTEPVVDWLFEVDEYMQNKKNFSNESHGESIEEHQEDVSTKRQSRAPTQDTLSVSSLLRLRSSIFPRDRPHRYFDPFASPIHFLRSPLMPVPQAHSLEEDFATLMGLDDVDYDVQGRPLGAGSNSNSSESQVKGSYPKGRPPRFPPASTNLRIPRLQLEVNDNSPLYGQNAEFVKLLRRSIVKYDSDHLPDVSIHERDNLEGATETDMEEQHNMALGRAVRYAENRASLSVNATGASSTSAGRRRVEQMGEWFRDVFAKSA